MSWTQRIHHPKDVLKEGDSVRVAVLAVDSGKRKISLSLKALGEDPWSKVAENYPPDSVVSGAVTRITNFGAFVQLEEGIEGLVHISQLSHDRVRAVTDVVKEGEVVQVKVLGVDLEQRRISLSIRDAKEAPEQAVEEAPQQPRKERKRPLRGGLTW
jgi:small subunit ribosomal protein S1